MPLKKLSKTKLSVLIFSFSILCLTLAFFLSGLTWKQIVDAFATKSANSNLTVNDWNGLVNDFVKKSGDTMTGGLTISSGGLNVSSGDLNVSDGNLYVKNNSTGHGNITADGGVTATYGNITATNGDITATNGDITAGGSISATHDITATNFHAGNAFYATNGYCIGNSCITSWPSSHFGGMYSSGDSQNSFVNPYTGGYSCPPGYTAHLIFKDTGHNAEYSNLYLCYKP